MRNIKKHHYLLILALLSLLIIVVGITVNTQQKRLLENQSTLLYEEAQNLVTFDNCVAEIKVYENRIYVFFNLLEYDEDNDNVMEYVRITDSLQEYIAKSKLTKVYKLKYVKIAFLKIEGDYPKSFKGEGIYNRTIYI